MICFDCGKKRLKEIPVLKRVNGKIEKVCFKCWKENWRRWMPETRETLNK